MMYLLVSKFWNPFSLTSAGVDVAMMVWITAKVKDGNLNQVMKVLDEPYGNAFTASQKGCKRLERSISHENPNHILLTELWSSKEDWDVYFASQQKLRDENGWMERLLPLVEEDWLQVTFYEMNKAL